jgi:hypothetical protein
VPEPAHKITCKVVTLILESAIAKHVRGVSSKKKKRLAMSKKSMGFSFVL